MRSYKLIGLTGTTGSGKGEVRRILEHSGCAVIDADALAREAVKDEVVLSALSFYFGDDIIRDGVLDRSLLASRAFESKEKTELLNRITHPIITVMFLAELKRLTQNYSFVVFDAPQLFESGLDVICDITVAVTASEEERVNRIMKRDSLTREQAESRVKAQYKDEFFINNCDVHINNSSTLGELEKRVREVFDL